MKKLTAIATAMTAVARNQGRAEHRLSGGLALTLLYNRLHGAWTLSLGRKLVKPSDKEIEICRRAFDVPADATLTRTVIRGWNVIRLEWLEPVAVQESMFDTRPLDGVSAYYERRRDV